MSAVCGIRAKNYLKNCCSLVSFSRRGIKCCGDTKRSNKASPKKGRIQAFIQLLPHIFIFQQVKFKNTFPVTCCANGIHQTNIYPSKVSIFKENLWQVSLKRRVLYYKLIVQAKLQWMVCYTLYYCKAINYQTNKVSICLIS